MTEHYCNEHNTVFFKKGRMKNFAHPVKNSAGTTIAWCNEPEESLEQPPDAPELKSRVTEKVSSSKPLADIAPQESLSQEMTKKDWAEREKVTRKSIERQKSLELAVEVAKQVNGVVETGKIIATAKVFEAYLEGINFKEVQPNKNRLVEEAMKLGKEIEEGD